MTGLNEIEDKAFILLSNRQRISHAIRFALLPLPTVYFSSAQKTAVISHCLGFDLSFDCQYTQTDNNNNNKPNGFTIRFLLF